MGGWNGHQSGSVQRIVETWFDQGRQSLSSINAGNFLSIGGKIIFPKRHSVVRSGSFTLFILLCLRMYEYIYLFTYIKYLNKLK